jgi:DNA-binding transcriptional LysR family regulator
MSATPLTLGFARDLKKGRGIVSRTLMADLRLPACSPALLRQHPIQSVTDLRRQTLLHSASTRTAWAHWLREAGAHDLRARHIEFDHVNLQLAAAGEGLGVTLASLPLIERDLASGRLVCPIAAPTWRAADYALVINVDRARDDAVVAFEQWITLMASVEAGPLEPLRG